MRRTFAVASAVAALGAALAAQAPYARLVNAEKEPGAWLTYNGTYDGKRHSRLAEIDTSNVARLQPAWVYQVRGDGQVETSPIVVDGVMYITEPPTTVTALDPRTGRPLWSYVRPMPSDVRLIGFPADQSRRRDPRRPALRRHARRLSRRARRRDRRGALGDQRGGQRPGPLDHDGAARARRKDHRRHQRRRGGHPRLRRRLRRGDRPAAVAHVHRSRAGRARRTTPGRATAGSTAPAPPGSPAPTTRSSTSSTGAPAIPGPTGTATCGRATTSTPAR